MKLFFNCYYISAQSYLLLFLPISLATGSFLPDLIVSITAVLFIIYCAVKKNFLYFNNKFFIFFLFWCFYLLVNSLLSDYIFNSLRSSIFYIRFGVLSICIYFLVKNSNFFLKYFSYSILFTFIIVIFDAYIQYFYGKNLLGYDYDGSRLGGLTGDELILGSYISRLFPLFFGLSFLLFKDDYKVYFLFLLLILSDVIIFLSGERAAFFYLFLFTSLLIILSSKHRNLRIISFTISIIFILVISYYDTKIKKRVFDLTLNEILGKQHLTNIESEEVKMLDILGQKFYAFSKYHTAHYITAIKIFQQNLFIGVGPRNYRMACDEEDFKSSFGCSTHPHNTYIQLLSETGILGVIPIFSIFVFISIIFLDKLTFNKFNIIKNNAHLLCCLIAIYISLWPFVPTGNFFNNWLSIIYFLPIGFILAELNNKEFDY